MKRQVVVLIGAALYTPFVAYPPLRLISWMLGDLSNVSWTLLLLLHVLLLPPYLSRSLRARLNRTLAVSLMTWYCLMFQLFLVLAPMELIRLVVTLDSAVSATIVLAGWLTLALTSIYSALQISVNPLTVTSDRGSQGKSLVQLSDVHIGTRKPGFLRRVVRKIEQLNPDAVLITGDLVDSRCVDSGTLSPLAELSAPVLFCTGNHERQEHLEDIVNWLRHHQVNVLRNESVDLCPFQFVGLEDQDSDEEICTALNALQPLEGRYRVVLCHKPVGVKNAALWGADLMLSGHTHHGQVFPFGFIVKSAYDPYRGLHKIKQMTLYISSGTGTTGPLMRLGTRNEITQIHFE